MASINRKSILIRMRSSQNRNKFLVNKGNAKLVKLCHILNYFFLLKKYTFFVKKCTPWRKHPQELLCKVRAPRFLWKLHVDFNFPEGHEKNIFSLRAAAQISECCKIRSNCKTHISSWCKRLNKKKLRTALVLIKSSQHR